MVFPYEPSRRRAVGKWETRSVFQGSLIADFSTAASSSELRRRAIVQGRVRSVVVVVSSPEVQLAASVDQATIWVDGDRIFFTTFAYKSPTQSTGLVGGFTDFALGFRLWGAAPDPFDIYYDDFALDTHRLGPVR